MIANFRMYEVAPSAARAWRALFERVFSEEGLELPIVEHRAPAPIADLWAREDLGCAFMCGWPFVRSGRMRPIAAPVPSPARYEHQARYCSEFLVREASGWRSLEETFGHRFGWMSPDSQSGFNAPRAHLARFVTAERPALFSEVRGPLGAPMATLEALRREEVDVIALDGFWLDLLRRHDAPKLEGIRCVATTPWTPIPLLVAAPHADDRAVDRLREVLPRIHERPGYASLLADVLLERFVAADVPSYAQLEALARSAEAAGYGAIR
ncbi:MAG TPA: PhnD/SsuA/transferrin family substrate-binding protein [Usitatibacter sp.]|nr:PhnD/SsuA/transferrin family substrate-binding protein [Usitatibacter sp.]